MAICRIFGGNCETPPGAKDEDFKPKLCEKSSAENKYGATIKIAVVKIGDEYSFLRQEMADGTVRLTVIPTNAELGLETGAGGKISLGKNFKLGADIKVGASVKVGVGDTYVFKNARRPTSSKVTSRNCPTATPPRTSPALRTRT
ncbi:MAG TPA: hypothetical protein VGP70_23510 [Actinomadura sp.]|nr:hypothetical protein [Actinomadura sp.]